MLVHALLASAVLLSQPAMADEPTGASVFQQEGQASYFRSGQGDNTITASGEPVDPTGYTAAHRTLPLGTRVTVTNQDTGKSVEVRINDRGPARRDRIIDVSEAAAVELGMEEAGIAPVVVEADPSRQADAEIQRQVEDLATAD